MRRTATPLRSVLPIAVMLCAGCQLLSVADLETPLDSPPVATADLEKLLAAGKWEANRDWSVLKSTIPRLDDLLTQNDLPKHRWLWVLSVPAQPDENALADAIKEKYADLLDAASSTTAHQAELTAVSRMTTDIGGAAAILLARHSSDRQDAVPLHEFLMYHFPSTIPENPVTPPQSLAAGIETWCDALAKLDGDPEANFADAGRLLERPQLAEDVRAELFRGIARKIPPRQIPGLNDVMIKLESERQASPLHLAAVEACVIHAWLLRQASSDSAFEANLWPDGLAACRFSQDVSLRKLYGRWAVLAGSPEALTALKSQRLDNDLSVREAAVFSLGWLPADAAQQELMAVMEKGTDPERVAAVACLARPDSTTLLRFARDDSPKVRAAVATEIGRNPTKSAAMSLSDFLGDRNPDVQLAALSACRTPAWDASGQVPLMLQALRVGSLRTRQQALSQLREIWGQEPVFPLDGTVEERELAVRRLSQEYNVSAEAFTVFEDVALATPKNTASAFQPETFRQLVRDFLHSPTDQPVDWNAVRPGDSSIAAAVTVIEQELGRTTGPQAEYLFREVLPRWHPGYAALITLEQTDAAARRQAARHLRKLADEGTLSALLLKRLLPRMTAEQDRQVWQEIVIAILPDALPDAAHIALVALNSPWPDIRLQGCEYFDRHPQPEYTAWLLPRLNDADPQVRIRAIRLLARCGNPAALDGYPQDKDSPGLRRFLTESDPQLRWEAVVAMSSLGDPMASQELIRQSYDSQPRQRELAVLTMGQTGQTRFLEPLLRRCWTESDRGVQAALLKSLDQLVPMNERPGLAPESSIGDKISQWARWWEQRQRQSAAKAPPSETPAGSPQ